MIDGGPAEALMIGQAQNPLEVIVGVWNSPVVRLALVALGAVIGAFWLALTYWAYKDARRRDYAPLFAAALCLLVPFAGVLLYAILRPPEYALDYEERELELLVLERELGGRESAECGACGQQVGASYVFCPYCGSGLKRSCGRCGAGLEDDYAYCPACGGRPSEPPRSDSGRRRPVTDNESRQQFTGSGGPPGARRAREKPEV